MLRLPSQPPHSASCLCIARRSLVPHTVSIAPYGHYRPHAISTASGLPYAATPVAALTTTSLFDVFPIFPTFPKCSHPPHHPFGNPCELTLHSINRILSKHIVELNEAESSRRLGHVRNTLWSVRRRCTLHCVIARQDSAARRRCAVVPLLQRHISDMPFIEAAFAHSAPQFSELERTMCFAHLQVSRLVFTALLRHSSHKMSSIIYLPLIEKTHCLICSDL